MRQFEEAPAHEIAHLNYLVERLERWAAVGVLPREAAEEAARMALAEIVAIQRRHGNGSMEAGPTFDELDHLLDVGLAAEPWPVSPPLPQPAEDVEPRDAARAKTEEPSTHGHTGPRFDWRQIGTYLLSERTLHGLLALGTFLILASGVVISTLNPTGLAPLFHLGVVAATTAVFFGVGSVILRKLRLDTAGETILAIGGAFVPLNISTLGQPQLLNWDPGAVWLVASLVSVPIYIGFHSLLRDRAFALLAAIAGCSQLLSVLNWLGLPLEWSLCFLMFLAMAYASLVPRLKVAWPLLSWALFWAGQLVAPLVMASLMLGKMFPGVWLASTGGSASGLFEYAVGLAWWLGATFYALSASLFQSRRYSYAAAWTVPVAYLFTLTKAPWGSEWYSLCLAVLAGVYLVFGKVTSRDATGSGAPEGYRQLARYPVYQVAGALTIIAALWPWGRPETSIPTLAVLSVVYGAASFLLGHRAWAYVSVYLLGGAFAWQLSRSGLGSDSLPLAWAIWSLVMVACGEIAVWRTGESVRSPVETAVGLGEWRSNFGSPLLSAGYLSTIFALWLAMSRYWVAPVLAGARELQVPVLAALMLIVLLWAASAAARRSSLFLHPAVWLLPVPFTSGAATIILALGLSLTEASMARLIACLGVIYLIVALVLDRAERHYSKPVYLAGYLLAAAAMLLSTGDRFVNLQVVAANVAVFAASAWLVHCGRHTAYLWAVDRLFGFGGVSHSVAKNAFMYAACWLFPVALLLAISLRSPAPSPAYYGLALSLLAPAYVWLGFRFDRIAPSYRMPWHTAGYALSAVGPMVAIPDAGVRVTALAVSTSLYAISAVAFRRAGWLYLVAGLAPVLLLLSMDLLRVPGRLFGLALVVMALAYGALGLALHHGDWRGLRRRIEGPIGPYAQPFLLGSYLVCSLGLAHAVNQDKWIVVAGFLLATMLYGTSTTIFRHPYWLYPSIGASVAAYLATLRLFAEAPSFAAAMAALVLPVWLLAAAAHALVAVPSAHKRNLLAFQISGSPWYHRWAAPLLHWGTGTMVVSAVGAFSDARTGLWVCLAYTILLSMAASLWYGEAEAWGAVVLGAAAIEEWLRISGVMLRDQPSVWSTVALIVSLVAVALDRVRGGKTGPWRRPLFWGSVGISTLAILGALASHSSAMTSHSLQQLAAATAISGLTLVTHGFNRRARLLVYLGVALVEAGYMLQLLYFEVGQPQAFAVPAGVYLLSVAYLEWHRGGPAGVKRTLESAGLLLMFVVSLIQAIGFLGDGHDRYFYDGYLFVQGLLLLGMGSVFRWKRSFFGSTFALVLDVGIMMADPIRATNTWYLVAAAGLVMIGAVVFVEQRRQQIPLWIGDVRQRLEDWD